MSATQCANPDPDSFCDSTPHIRLRVGMHARDDYHAQLRRFVVNLGPLSRTFRTGPRMDAQHPPRVFISAAEQSADEHAAAFITAARNLLGPIEFEGLAGPAMRAAGCECFHDMTTRSAMALKALGRVPEAWMMMNRLKRHVATRQFDAAVLVDSPTLHLPMSRIFRARGIPVLYYIAPQTWAWAPWRNARIAQRVTRLACIWKFEEAYFRGHGIEATYVGHPSFDHFLSTKVDTSRVTALRAGSTPVITLLPGSRKHVVDEVFPGQLAVAKALSSRFRQLRCIIVAANAGVREQLARYLAGMHLNHEVVIGAEERAAAIEAADLVLAASGTVTLEVAYRGAPMIVMYNHGRWLYTLAGRFLIRLKHLSIPNILAERQIVPEFMPFYHTVDPIIARALELLSTPASLERMRAELKSLIGPMVKPGAADNTAQELAKLLAMRKPPPVQRSLPEEALRTDSQMAEMTPTLPPSPTARDGLSFEATLR